MVQYVDTANLIWLVDSIGVQGTDFFIDIDLLAQPADPRNLFGLLGASACSDPVSARTTE